MFIVYFYRERYLYNETLNNACYIELLCLQHEVLTDTIQSLIMEVLSETKQERHDKLVYLEYQVKLLRMKRYWNKYVLMIFIDILMIFIDDY